MPSVPKSAWRALRKNVLGNSKSSLAVFYVEQVALNRHVSSTAAIAAGFAANTAVLFMLENEGHVKRNETSRSMEAEASGYKLLTQLWRLDNKIAVPCVQ